ncbi:MAG: hypothetical protein FWE18_05780 [Alphaproteobacteria bacterium]|nr:hypothetical protein [Alphaproteobacteria bacterium]
MLQSDQIMNENSMPKIKNSAINLQGKIKILAFDVNFSQKETVEQEEILLVKLPKTENRITQIGFTCSEGAAEDTFDLLVLDVLYNAVSNKYEILKSSNLKTGIALNRSGGALFYYNNIIKPSPQVNVEKYIALKASIAFSKANILNGYVLYTAD